MLLNLIGNDGIAKEELFAEMGTLDLTREQTSSLIDDLIDERLVGWDGEQLVFLTQRCTTIFTPKDGIVVHDLANDRLAEWMGRPERWNQIDSLDV